MSSLLSMLSNASTALQLMKEVQQQTAQAKAQNPGAAPAWPTWIDDMGRAEVAAQRRANGGQVNLHRYSENLAVDTWENRQIEQIKAVANERHRIAGTLQTYRPVYVIRVPLAMSGPHDGIRRALINGLVSRSPQTSTSQSLFMHWAIRIDNRIFELQRRPGQPKPVFAKVVWSAPQLQAITSQELYGHTHMTDEDVEDIGHAYIEAVNKRYDLLDNNCHRLVHEVLHHILPSSSGPSTHSPDTTPPLPDRTITHPAGIKVGGLLSKALFKLPVARREADAVGPVLQTFIPRVYGEEEGRRVLASLPSQEQMVAQAAAEILSKRLGRVLGTFS